MTRLKDLEAEENIPVVIADHNGLIIRVNSRFERVFLWPSPAIPGRLLTVIIPPALRDAHHLGFSRFIGAGRSSLLDQELDLEIRRGDGKRLRARHHIIAEKIDGRWFLGASLNPEI